MTNLKAELARGYYGVDYSLNESVDSLLALKKRMQDADHPHYTGWPPFVWLNEEPHRPIVIDQHTYRSTIIAEKLFRPHYERWTASTRGNFTLVRAHDLDHHPEYREHHAIALTTPVWRIAELMLHAGRLAEQFGASAIEFTVQFTGLKGRHLLSLPESNRWLSGDYKTGASDYKKTVTLDATAVDAGVTAFTDRLMRPFYELFEFTLPGNLCEQEIGKMRSNRF